MRKIICHFFMFDQYQRIMLNSPEETKCVKVSTFEQIDKDIVAACAECETDEVLLIGNSSYAKKIREDILNINQNIKVEVKEG